MTIGSFDVLFYTMTFVVPGFIWDPVLTSLVPRREQSNERALMRFLFLSSLNYGLCFPLIYILLKTDLLTGSPLLAGLGWWFVVAVAPALLGFVSGWQSQRALWRRLLNRIGISTIHPVPTAWESYFSTCTEGWILVTLKDGSQVAGYFGLGSYASSDTTDRDLYIESIYVVSETGRWTEVPLNAGVLIRGDQIKHIEFMRFRVE